MTKGLIFKRYAMIVLGVILIVLPYYFLFLPLGIVTGGLTGLSVIFVKIFGESFSPSVFMLFVNIILVFVGLFILGKEFFIRTIFGSLLLPALTGILEFCKVPTDAFFDLEQLIVGVEMTTLSKIIIAVVFGGVIMGAGLGLCFKANATTGGMDVIQKIISKLTHLPYSKTVYITDGIIVLAGLFVFGVELTAYALITIYIEGIVTDIVSLGGRAKRTVFIISKCDEEIKKYIINTLERGVTVVPSSGGYSGDKYDMLVTTLSREESMKLKDVIFSIDPAAFTFYVAAKEVFGYGFEQE